MREAAIILGVTVEKSVQQELWAALLAPLLLREARDTASSSLDVSRIGCRFPNSAQDDVEVIKDIRVILPISEKCQSETIAYITFEFDAEISRFDGSNSDEGFVEIGPVALRIKAKHFPKPLDTLASGITN